MKNAIILMATYNGQKYINEQIDSIIGQTVNEWELWISDDGSKDETKKIILDYMEKFPEKIFLLDGPKKGSAKNFFSLLKKCPDAQYYFFSDQDDIWYPKKIEYAMNWFQSNNKDSMLLYGARTRIVENGIKINSTNNFKNLCFKNALVQNVLPGNTMAFNNAVKLCIGRLLYDIDAPFHDWFIYQVVSGVGGNVYIDNKYVLDYRQHENNILGENKSILSKLVRLKKILKLEYRDWNTLNLNELKNIKQYFSDENIHALENFYRSKNTVLIKSIFYLRKSGVFRQNYKEKYILYVLAFLGML